MVPTFRRPAELNRCLAALAAQTRLPDQVIVITRDEDEVSQRTARQWIDALALSTVEVKVPGVVQALNTGLRYATGDLVAVTDDDAAGRADWLLRVEQHFLKDDRLGGLGGRDVLHENGRSIEPSSSDVGRIHAFGRISGNHHIGLGAARDVDHLKGVNMTWRRVALPLEGFDTSLHGAGAQVYFELAASLAVKSKGWTLRYDPAVVVDHYPAVRFDADQRGKVHLQSVENTSYNLYWSLLRHMKRGPRRMAALLWERYIGARNRPGSLRAVGARTGANTERYEVAQAAARGRMQALKAYASRMHA